MLMFCYLQCTKAKEVNVGLLPVIGCLKNSGTVLGSLEPVVDVEHHVNEDVTIDVVVDGEVIIISVVAIVICRF